MSYCDANGRPTDTPPPLRYPERKVGKPTKPASRRPGLPYLIFSAALIAAAIAAAVYAPRAHAQPQPCGPREKIIKRLAEKFGETQRSMGLSRPVTSVLEVWANDETGTWTVIISKPDGSSCLLSNGTAWLQNAGPSGPQGDDV